MKIAIIIPARYASTRLPGKPLALIAGKTMLSRVVELARSVAKQANKCEIEIAVATEDERIVKHASDIGARAVLTSNRCRTGTDRVLEAIESIGESHDYVINLQGDAPLTPPEFILSMIDEITSNPNLQVVTPVVQLSWDKLDDLHENKKATPFSGTTAIIDKYNDALWFSKNIIPAIRKEDDLRKTDKLSPIYMHVGIYGYSMQVLQEFANLPESYYEKLEGLEQLRLLENGYKIKVVKVDCQNKPLTSGVDSPEDIKRAEELLKKMGEQ